MFIALILAICLQCSSGFFFPTSLPMRHSSSSRAIILGIKKTPCCLFGFTARRGLSKLAMSEDVEELGPNDFASYKVGQEYAGKVTIIKNNGVMVNITSSVGVIVPKSRMSVLDFEKLRGMHMRRSEELVNVEIIDVKVANKTMYGKYTDKTNVERGNLSALAKMDVEELRKIDHNATVVSARENGLFVQLNEFGIGGFVSWLNFGDPIPPAYIKKFYKQGRQVVVNMDYVNVTSKQLVLSMPPDTSKLVKGDIKSYIGVTNDWWHTGEVVKVFKKALHVRPAYHNTPGVLALENMPPELVETLKKRVSEIDPDPNAPPYTPNTTWDTDLRRLLQAGDILKVRLQSIDFETDSVELTMHPTEAEHKRYSLTPTIEELKAERLKTKSGRGDEDSKKHKKRGPRSINTTELYAKFDIDTSLRFKGIRLDDMEYLPEWANYTEPEPVVHRLERDGVVVEWTDEQEEAEYLADQAAEHIALKKKFLERKPAEVYYPEEKLEWWRGAPFVTSYVLAAQAEAEERAKSDGILETHEEIMAESHEMKQGTWRRLWTVDAMAVEKDFDDNALGRELQTIQDEIGEMDGFHIGLEKGFGQVFDHTANNTFPLGASIPREHIPLPWRDEITFYKKLDERIAAVQKDFRAEGFRDTRKLNRVADEKAILAEYYRVEEDARLGEVEQKIGWKPGDPDVTSETHPPTRVLRAPRRVWKKKGDISPPSAEDVSESLS